MFCVCEPHSIWQNRYENTWFLKVVTITEIEQPRISDLAIRPQPSDLFRGLLVAQVAVGVSLLH